MEEHEILAAIEAGDLRLEVRDERIVGDHGEVEVLQELRILTRRASHTWRFLRGWAAEEILRRLLLPVQNEEDLLSEAQLRIALGLPGKAIDEVDLTQEPVQAPASHLAAYEALWGQNGAPKDEPPPPASASFQEEIVVEADPAAEVSIETRGAAR